VTGYLAALAIVLLLGTVITRVLLLRRAGTQAVHLGNLDKTDFLIPPVALFYFVRRRNDLPFHWIFLLFGLFILGCGGTDAQTLEGARVRELS